MALTFNAFSQVEKIKSIHQEESEYYKNLGYSAEYYQENNKPAKVTHNTDKTCVLNKVVFGWHPYWSNGLEVNYDWSLISDLSYFSYDVVASTGQASSTHSWATANVVTQALANGKRVNLCVTLFSDHATFFGSSTAQNTLISNLINLVQTRGAHGVNIDFEGVPSSQKTNFTNFMINLCNQMHASIPGSQVSMALYAVDWNTVFDMPTLNNYVDLFVIMGYDYYYSGSTTAGPNDPLYHFGTTYNYTLSKTITYYLNQGCTPSKLILGLPYYGREYTTTTGTYPTSVLNPPNSASRTYKVVRDNTSGNYSFANKQFDVASCSPLYIFQSSGNWKQCFINDKYSMAKRFDIVNYRGIGGIGIWAMGYDDGYPEYWDNIKEKFTNCGTVACTDTIYDMGGPLKDYYNSESYTYTIKPTGATGLSLNFTSFNLENNFDYLRIFNGTDTTNLIGHYTGSTNPGLITANGNALTLKFKSDGATVASGFSAIWQCTIDNIPPTTSISTPLWATTDFSSNFTDNDNIQLEKKYYQVLDYNGTEWRANSNYGFFNDNFETAIHSDWTSTSGTWTINSGHLHQTQQVNSNTNIYTSVSQDSLHTYLYHWQMKLDGTGTNRRAGMYIFSDNPTLTQRGNAYMIYYRADQNKVQLYTVKNDVINIVTDIVCDVLPNVWYDYKVTYNPSTGELKTYQNNILKSSYTDPNPLKSGLAISLRNGDCDVMYDDIKVYKTRTNTEIVTIGTNKEVRYQNTNPTTASCRVKSIVFDHVGNISQIAGTDVNIDWTQPSDVSINDGISSDIDTITSNNALSANWTNSTDMHSGISEYWYCVGTSPGSDNTVSWTNNGLNTSFNISGLSLQYGATYYTTIKSKNGAGLFSNIISSDGVYLVLTASANFNSNYTTICTGDVVQFSNNSQNSTSYFWEFEGGTPSNSTLENPIVAYQNDGQYSVKLIAYNSYSSDTIYLTNYITVNSRPIANFTTNQYSGNIPLTILFTNNSTNSSSYLWDFGNGASSNGINPYYIYQDTGHYSVKLIACNLNCPCDTFLYQNQIYAYDTTVNINIIYNDKFVIYPNPFKNTINIIGINEKIDNNFVIKIYDSSNKLVRIKKQINENSINIELDEKIPSGNYNLIINYNNNNTKSYKIIKVEN